MVSPTSLPKSTHGEVSESITLLSEFTNAKKVAFERIKDIPFETVCSGFTQAPHKLESSHLSW